MNLQFIEHDGKKIEIIKHIGKGKGGNSYLAKMDDQFVVFKEMHYEKCESYTFQANKLQSELCDYQRLKEIGIRMPKLLGYNDERQFLIKEYIDGNTIAEIVGEDELKDDYVNQMFEICNRLYKNDLNIDYFPTNFVVQNDLLYYIDYECNQYMEEWDFENWGIYFWANTKGMTKFIETGNHDFLSKNAKPHKEDLENKVNYWIKFFKKN